MRKKGWEGRTKGTNEPAEVSPYLYFAAPVLTLLSLKVHLPKSCCWMFTASSPEAQSTDKQELQTQVIYPAAKH